METEVGQGHTDMSASTVTSRFYETEVTLLISKASMASNDQKAKLENLRRVKEIIVNREPTLLNSFFDDMLKLLFDNIPKVRIFILEFIEDICQLHPGVIPKVLPHMQLLMSDPIASVQKKVIQLMAKVYKMTLMWICRSKTATQGMIDAWNTVYVLKKNIVKKIDSVNAGVRLHTVKFMETVILLQTPIEPDSVQRKNEFSLNDIVKILQPVKLGEDAMLLFDDLLRFHCSRQATSVNLMTCTGSLVIISKLRPSFMGRVVAAMEKLNAILPPALERSPVHSVRKHMSGQLIGLLKHSKALDYYENITTLLTDLGVSFNALSKAIKNLEKIVAEKDQRQGGKITVSKPALEDEVPSCALQIEATLQTCPLPAAAVAEDIIFHSETVENLVLAKLSPTMAADLVISFMDRLPDVLPKHFKTTHIQVPRKDKKNRDAAREIARLLAAEIDSRDLTAWAKILLSTKPNPPLQSTMCESDMQVTEKTPVKNLLTTPPKQPIASSKLDDLLIKSSLLRNEYIGTTLSILVEVEKQNKAKLQNCQQATSYQATSLQVETQNEVPIPVISPAPTTLHENLTDDEDMDQLPTMPKSVQIHATEIGSKVSSTVLPLLFSNKMAGKVKLSLSPKKPENSDTLHENLTDDEDTSTVGDRLLLLQGSVRPSMSKSVPINATEIDSKASIVLSSSLTNEMEEKEKRSCPVKLEDCDALHENLTDDEDMQSFPSSNWDADGIYTPPVPISCDYCPMCKVGHRGSACSLKEDNETWKQWFQSNPDCDRKALSTQTKNNKKHWKMVRAIEKRMHPSTAQLPAKKANYARESQSKLRSSRSAHSTTPQLPSSPTWNYPFQMFTQTNTTTPFQSHSSSELPVQFNNDFKAQSNPVHQRVHDLPESSGTEDLNDSEIPRSQIICSKCDRMGHPESQCWVGRTKEDVKEYYRNNPEKKNHQNSRKNANRRRNKHIKNLMQPSLVTSHLLESQSDQDGHWNIEQDRHEMSTAANVRDLVSHRRAGQTHGHAIDSRNQDDKLRHQAEKADQYSPTFSSQPGVHRLYQHQLAQPLVPFGFTSAQEANAGRKHEQRTISNSQNTNEAVEYDEAYSDVSQDSLVSDNSNEIPYCNETICTHCQTKGHPESQCWLKGDKQSRKEFFKNNPDKNRLNNTANYNKRRNRRELKKRMDIPGLTSEPSPELQDVAHSNARSSFPSSVRETLSSSYNAQFMYTQQITQSYQMLTSEESIQERHYGSSNTTQPLFSQGSSGASHTFQPDSTLPSLFQSYPAAQQTPQHQREQIVVTFSNSQPDTLAPSSPPACYRCRQPGHRYAECVFGKNKKIRAAELKAYYNSHPEKKMLRKEKQLQNLLDNPEKRILRKVKKLQNLLNESDNRTPRNKKNLEKLLDKTRRKLEEYGKPK